VATGKGVERGTDGTTPEAIVLATKLTRPVVRPQHVPRHELIVMLRARPRPRVTLVAAPPGFGKTTVLAELALAEETAGPEDGASVAWLSVDEDDNDPARFVSHFVAALQRVEPEAGARALIALRSPGADLLGLVLPSLLNDLARLDREVLLVLDDYYLVTSAEVHSALAYVIGHLPSSVRLVIGTREDPPLPLGRWRASGELLEIRADALRFSGKETASFLVDVLGLPLAPDDVGRLQERTEGWPAALYLAALTLRGRAEADASAVIERYAGDDRYLVDYLTSEVLARQTPELRSFLIRTSILKRLCAPLCDALTDRADSAPVLAELERTNLLLVPLDTKREWYRYHHLFGELLQFELYASDRGLVSDLHRRASAWYRDAGMVVDAETHAAAGGDIDTAVEILATHYAEFVDQGQLTTVTRWIDALPADAFAKDWLVCFTAGLVAAHAGRFDDAERWLATAEAAPQVLRLGMEPAGPLAALASYLRLLRGDIGGTVEHGRRALAAEPAAEPMWALGPQMVLAPGLWWAGEAREADTILQAAGRTADAAGIDATVVYALAIRAAIALDREDEGSAAALVAGAVERMRAGGLDDHPWAALTHIVNGTLLGRRGDLSSAAEEVERGVVLGERLRAWQLIACGLLALAEVRHRQRQPTEARRLLTRVRELLASLPDPGDGFDRLERTEKVLRLRASRERAAAAPYWELSPRELDVLRLLPSELSQREIAAELYVSFNTLRTHTRVIFSKLGVASRGEAVARARELGLL
jgi:LuxR family maltose regulon positive regulatory protein